MQYRFSLLLLLIFSPLVAMDTPQPPLRPIVRTPPFSSVASPSTTHMMPPSLPYQPTSPRPPFMPLHLPPYLPRPIPPPMAPMPQPMMPPQQLPTTHVNYSLLIPILGDADQSSPPSTPTRSASPNDNWEEPGKVILDQRLALSLSGRLGAFYSVALPHSELVSHYLNAYQPSNKQVEDMLRSIESDVKFATCFVNQGITASAKLIADSCYGALGNPQSYDSRHRNTVLRLLKSVDQLKTRIKWIDHFKGSD